MSAGPSETINGGGSHTVARFAETHWSIVLSAAEKRGDTHALQARENLCRIYWPPLYAFIRRRGNNPQDAQDLTQEFFARLLEKDFLASVDQSKGRFRSFMLAALKHFLCNESDHQHAQKRGGGAPLLSLDAHDADSHAGFEAAQNITPEVDFQRRWAAALLAESLARLRRAYAAEGKEPLFEAIKHTLTEDRSTISYATLGERIGLSEAAVKMAVHRLRTRYREAIRAEIGATVADPAEIEDELREVLRAYGK